jgi:hypothetical protein
MYVIQPSGQRKGEIGAHEDILGIASIHRVSGEGGPIAQIFHVVMTVPAIAIDTAHPGNADPRSERQLRGRAFDHFPDDLMTGYELRSKRRQISFNDVQVSATDSAGNHPKQNMSGCELWTGDILNIKERSWR